ncbi:PHF20L1 isoform 4, partial [Pongo abelii]
EVTAPVASDSSYHNECPRAEKEDTQMLPNPSSKAIADGRGAPAAAGISKTEKKMKLEEKSSTAFGIRSWDFSALLMKIPSYSPISLSGLPES